MKKVAILTWLNNENYGSILQAYALQRFIIKSGYDAIDIDYNPSSIVRLENWLVNRNSPKLFVDKLKKKSNKILNKNKIDFSIRKQKFDQFKKENINITKRYSKFKELENINNKYDIYVCGSDQIWSPKLMNPVFFFSFLDKNQYKISYAPSLGVSYISKEKEKKIAELLDPFSYISVREQQGKEILNSIGLNKDVTVQVDPTILLTAEEWKRIINSSKEKEKYILLYLLSDNEEYIKKVKEIAHENNLKVRIILTDIGPFNTGFDEVKDSGPKEWLTLINNAEYVFTDSFHGAIFSMIFNKQFTLFKRFCDNKKNSENSRIHNLANVFGIENVIADKDTIIDIEHKIDYSEINKKIEKERKKSSEWLLNALVGAKNEKCE